jgi:hypothetical protein
MQGSDPAFVRLAFASGSSRREGCRSSWRVVVQPMHVRHRSREVRAGAFMREPANGNIRNANRLDTPELSRLIATSTVPRDVDAGDVGGWLERGYLLVLDRHDGTLGAVVHVDAQRGVVDLLVVDPTLDRRAVESRMAGVASAMCEAHGGAATRRVASGLDRPRC